MLSVPACRSRSKPSGAFGGACGRLASWWGNGSPRRRSVAGLEGRPPRWGLRYGPDSYGRQQLGILRNGQTPDAATPRGGRRPSGRKPLLQGKQLPVTCEEATANYVPAAAVIRRWRALSGFTGRKARAGGLPRLGGNLPAQRGGVFRDWQARGE